MELNKRVFNTLNEIREAYEVDVFLPETIPDGCNIICYKLIHNSMIVTDFYKETSEELLYFYRGGWTETGNTKLVDEVYDDILNEYECVYLRLTQQEKKENFTPKRLLGVLTDHGYIIDVGIRYITTTGYLYCTLDTLKFYVSDDSDETVSFDEYVDIFY